MKTVFLTVYGFLVFLCASTLITGIVSVQASAKKINTFKQQQEQQNKLAENQRTLKFN